MSVLDRNSVISTNFFHINVEEKSKTKIRTDLNNKDLEVYLETLLVEIHNKEQSRQFILPPSSTIFKQTITIISSSKNLETGSAGETLAEKLLNIEMSTDERYGHLSKKDTHVKVGSFLQFTYTEKGLLRYLGVKVDHQVILDEIDFKKKAGLGLSEKIYKAFRIDFDEKNQPTRFSIYDSKAKLTKYWWHDFLELIEKNTDTYNTKLASEQVIAKLSNLKVDFPQDYTALRNATIVAFKQEGTMDYFAFIDRTIASYKSDNQDFDEKKIDIIKKLKELPQKKNFDTIFTLVPSAVPFRKTTYRLNKDISLSITEGILNLESKIWREITLDGKDLVVIETSEAKNFTLKKRRL
ncbi:hypothetical protein Q1J68_00725 [Pseudomonas pergaminensis]|uniref:hypothetical protein n=1 Tax=Pseudomonas pergaminensis TaxID=2853159 RepID=UPI0034D55792